MTPYIKFADAQTLREQCIVISECRWHVRVWFKLLSYL